jgi:hypothetical protein
MRKTAPDVSSGRGLFALSTPQAFFDALTPSPV